MHAIYEPTMRSALIIFRRRGDVGKLVSRDDFQDAWTSIHDYQFTVESTAIMLFILKATEQDVGPSATKAIAACRMA